MTTIRVPTSTVRSDLNAVGDRGSFPHPEPLTSPPNLAGLSSDGPALSWEG